MMGSNGSAFYLFGALNLKTVFKFILYAGAIVCCLAGLWIIYVAITNFREMIFPAWLVVLIMEVVFVCLAFAPAFMLFKGLKTKTWHWVLIGIVETFVIALSVFAFVFYAVTPHGQPDSHRAKTTLSC